VALVAVDGANVFYRPTMKEEQAVPPSVTSSYIVSHHHTLCHIIIHGANVFYRPTMKEEQAVPPVCVCACVCACVCVCIGSDSSETALFRRGWRLCRAPPAL
jgi:hypothetical protein